MESTFSTEFSTAAPVNFRLVCGFFMDFPTLSTDFSTFCGQTLCISDYTRRSIHKAKNSRSSVIYPHKIIEKL